MRFIDREEVARRLTYDVCIPIVREAMIAFSKGETNQLLRSIIPLSEGRLFGIMPGAMGAHAPFGAKLISVFHENFARGIQSHQGLVILFDPETGAPVCAVHAGEITAIRTAAASAVATDALARKDARRLAICSAMANRLRPTRGRSARFAILNPSSFGGGRPNAPGPSRSGCKRNSPCRSPPRGRARSSRRGRHRLYRYLSG